MADGQAVEYSLMNLHDHSDAFAELVAVAAETIGLPEIYIEKDYWVTHALKHLAQSSYIDAVVFKGGTSLSKAFRLIDRFSEDIDLALLSTSKSDSARKRLLKSVEAVMTKNLVSLKGDERESKGSKFRKTVYQYPRRVENNNFGQASSELLIEINAFTHPEPFERRKLQTLIAEVLVDKDQQVLIDQYGLQSFSINVLSAKRTLIEKMLGVIKDSYDDDPVAKLSARIRHLYDICLILREEQYREFIAGDDFLLLCQRCMNEEKAGGMVAPDYLEKPLMDAPLFSQFEKWRPALETTYSGIFSELVYGDLPAIEEISAALQLLRDALD